MKIDKSIPVPPGNGNGITGRYSETARQMEIGDSVGGLDKKNRLGLINALKSAYQRKEFVVVNANRRTEFRVMNKVYRSMIQDDGTYRVWRVDMPTKYADLKTNQILDYHQQKTGNER